MQVRIVVGNRVRLWMGNTAEQVLPEALLRAVRDKFTHRLPKTGEPKATWNVDPTPEGTWLTLPRGGMNRLRQVLRTLGTQWTLTDARTTGDPALAGCIPPLRRPLWGYQDEAVTAAIARQNCLIRAPTGSGKTTAAFAIASRVNLGTLILLDDGGLFKQWVERCTTELGIAPGDVGRVKGPERAWSIKPITIASTMTLYKHPEFFTKHGHRFGLVIADEVQGFAAKTMWACVDPLPAKFRIGVSADETRRDEMEFLVYDLFGDVAADIPMSRVVASGHVHDVTIRVVPTAFRADWYRPAMAGARGERARQMAWKRLLEEMTSDADRNAVVAFYAHKEAAKGHRVMVWSHRVEHCRTLDHLLAQTGVMSGLLLGGAGQSKEFDTTRQGLLNGTLRAGVGTLEAIGQAIDIPVVDRGVISTPLAMNRQRFNQARGRICRVAQGSAKVDAELYYLWDRNVFGRQHVENLVKWYGARVLVLDDEGGWVRAQEYIRTLKRDNAARRDDFDGLFGGSE